MFDDVSHEEHIPDEPSAESKDQHSGVEPEVQNVMNQDRLAESNPISQVRDQHQLTVSSPISQLHEVSNTPHLQSPDLDINDEWADQSERHLKKDPTLDAVMVTPGPSTRRGEEKALDYYIDMAAVLNYPEEHHAKTEDGEDPCSDGSSDEGSLGFHPPLGFMGNFGYLCDSEGRMEMSVDYVRPEPLNRQRHVLQEHPPDVEVNIWDESKDLPAHTLARSPVFDDGENMDVRGNQAHIVSGKPARHAEGKILRIRNRQGASRYVRSTGESCILTPEWYKGICDWPREEFRWELYPLPKFQADHAAKPNPSLTSSRRQQKKRMQMLTPDQNGRPMGYFVPWETTPCFCIPRSPRLPE